VEDAVSELNRDAERLLGKAREALSPSAADRKRVRGGLARKLGVAAGVAAVATALESAATAGPAAGAAANAAATGVSAVLIAKIVVPIVAIGLAVTAVLPAVHGRAATEHVAESSPSPAVPAAAAKRAVDVPAPIPRVEARVEARKAPEVATPQVQRVSVARRSDVSVPDRAREEIELVAGIQSALAANDGDRALALVAEHARRFPQGALAEEREGARVLALCMRETPQRAKALGKAFLDAHPRSPLRGRVQATCGSDGSE
jgi:hypothetical protein